MSLIPDDRFRTFAPHADQAPRVALEKAAADEGFCGLVLAHWLGQMHVESGGFTTREESLDYGTEARLKLCGRHRISAADAYKFGRTKYHRAHRKVGAAVERGTSARSPPVPPEITVAVALAPVGDSGQNGIGIVNPWAVTRGGGPL